MAVGKPAGEEEEGKKFRGGLGGWRLPSGQEKKNVRVSVFCVFGSLSPKLQNDPLLVC